MYSKANHSLLLQNMPDAYAYHQIIRNELGKPVDYILLEANQSFGEMTGLNINSIIGKRVTEVLPGIETGSFDWIETFGEVATNVETITFEQYSGPLDRWYKVVAFSDKKGYFATIFQNITEKIKSEQNMRKIIEASEQFLK
ncbi:PAS domain-containing protein [Desulfitispora alkaliphila]|uniref:hypothetical protein n=1 Tax=Desulfitispora alkaliphila TaxID=622674 RepID=UPI003D1FE94D